MPRPVFLLIPSEVSLHHRHFRWSSDHEHLCGCTSTSSGRTDLYSILGFRQAEQVAKPPPQTPPPLSLQSHTAHPVRMNRH